MPVWAYLQLIVIFVAQYERFAVSDWSASKYAFDDEALQASTIKIWKGNLMANGTVKWFNHEKGYGFIQPDDGGKDAFVHISAVEQAGLNDLREGQKVSFELVSDQRTGKVSAGKLEILG